MHTGELKHPTPTEFILSNGPKPIKVAFRLGLPDLLRRGKGTQLRICQTFGFIAQQHEIASGHQRRIPASPGRGQHLEHVVLEATRRRRMLKARFAEGYALDNFLDAFEPVSDHG